MLLDALAIFSTNRVSASSAIQGLRASDPLRLALAAVQLIASAKEKSPALEYLAALLTTGSLLTEVLMNQNTLPLEAAVALAQKVAAFDPRLDVRLVRQVSANATDGIGSIPSAVALRLLGLVDAISDCLLLAPNLIQFQRHPSDKVRSKAALMLGRCNWNLNRLENQMASDDGRVRANAVEALWGNVHEKVRTILWSATEDPCRRVALNALVGLCQAGDRAAYRRLTELADTFDPLTRSGVAWAMGEIGDPEFADALEKLGQDHDAKVREMVARSQKRLRMPVKPSSGDYSTKPADLPDNVAGDSGDSSVGTRRPPTRDIYDI